MITPELKDKILACIIAQGSLQQDLNFMKLEESTGIPYQYARLIIEQFERLGFLKRQGYTGGCFIFLKAEIYDHYNHGGFVAQEEILRANLQKLDYELTKLSQDIDPGLTDRINRIAGIAASVATALSLFKS